MTCSARQYSDQMHCGRCALQWDVNDPQPPTCQRLAPEPADPSFLNGGPARTGMSGHRLIAFAGAKGSGKDTAARVLLDNDWSNVKFADGLKVMLRALLAFRGCPEPEIKRMLEGDLKETPTRYLSGRTPRHAMQTLGTDWARKLMSPDFWVETTEDRLDRTPRAVITDVRFHNEAALVERRGGWLYLVERPDAACGDDHVSETELRTLRVDGVLRNDADSAGAFRDVAGQRMIDDGLLT